jgi:hypothetical protein
MRRCSNVTTAINTEQARAVKHHDHPFGRAGT